MNVPPHQYVARDTRRLITETLLADGIIDALYSRVREHSPWLFDRLTSARTSRLLGFLAYDMHRPGGSRTIARLMDRLGIRASDCLDDPSTFKTPRDLFERRIPFWATRPMPEDPGAVVAPADARMVIGNLDHQPLVRIKEKFFCIDGLLGPDKQCWRRIFADGAFAVFRLTPDKYHYNHVPVDGRIVDIYELSGRYHACNPGTAVHLATPLSRNRRIVTVIDTDPPGGTGIGRVAMIEIVALMIGDIVQRYSDHRYDAPSDVIRGMWLKKGQPKSLFRPGSSTVVLVFENGRIRFDGDIVRNLSRQDASSRYTLAFSQALVETEVTVRSQIATRRPRP